MNKYIKYEDIHYLNNLLYKIDKKDKEVERLSNIIKEAKEYIDWHYDLATDENVEFCLLRDRLLDILDKDNK